MTLQKLYEKMIMMTADIAKMDDENPLFNIVDQLPDEYTFEYLCMQADLLGFHIPGKEDFVNWGEDYLIQCLNTTTRYQYHDELQALLNTCFTSSKLKKLIGDNFANRCFDIYIDSVMYDHDVAYILSNIIIKHFSHYEFFKEFHTVAAATGLYDKSISYSEFMKLKNI